MGLKIEKSDSTKWRKLWLILSIGINLGFLGFFKYYNFFIHSFTDLLLSLGINTNVSTLKYIIPVGISFYTFHGLSYVFDIYNRKILARKNWIDYSLFVSFFPLLVAGPIERATHLLPQIENNRKFQLGKAVDGLKQIAWGLFKKIIIADNCAVYVNLIFDNPSQYHGSTLMLGAFLFSFQIYGDFSGYSDMALGSARLFGFELLKNFSFPYFSKSISEFWKRWHISLSSWFRDYLYIPLGGNRVNKFRQILNVLIVFIVSGFWHGANWTFMIWGFVNGVFVVIDNFFNYEFKQPKTEDKAKNFTSFINVLQIIFTFTIVSLIWVIFRSDDITSAFTYFKYLFNRTFFSIPEIRPSVLGALLLFFIFVEWVGRRQDFALSNLFQNKLLRTSFYLLIFAVLILFSAKPQTFIYFQF
jgi:D-alanyl-lipoteichoic acid acyltransferase DltB (MBOAT superfamily)